MEDLAGNESAWTEAGASLINVVLLSVEADIQNSTSAQLIKFKYRVWTSTSMSQRGFNCEYLYQVRLEDSAQVEVATLAAKFRLDFEADEDNLPERNDLDSFSRLSGLQIVHPYALELFRSLSGRLGFPPVILDVSPPHIDP